MHANLFYKGWLPLTKRFLHTFDFSRYHFLRPLVIYVLFALGLKILWPREKRNRYGTFICIKLNKARTAPSISKKGSRTIF
ncbi:DUF6044 family protein [Saccharococcus thermophilus]|uniref:DUF6044 family protein n=1 Tax=Saccharococcus thermophilus TaxID=29396 RepID=UPI0036271C8F